MHPGHPQDLLQHIFAQKYVFGDQERNLVPPDFRLPQCLLLLDELVQNEDSDAGLPCSQGNKQLNFSSVREQLMTLAAADSNAELLLASQLPSMLSSTDGAATNQLTDPMDPLPVRPQNPKNNFSNAFRFRILITRHSNGMYLVYHWGPPRAGARNRSRTWMRMTRCGKRCCPCASRF